MKVIMTIAGSDSCGGAGIQADMKTFHALGAYGVSVITAVTAQNTMGISVVREMEADIVKEQIDCLFNDISIDAVKIGMVSSIEIIRVVAGCLKKHKANNIIVDPVMNSKGGYHLISREAIKELVQELFPLAGVVTPNLDEAGFITGAKVESLEQMKAAARDILAMGARRVIVKGGHLKGDPVDLLYDGENYDYVKGARIYAKNTHGTGCTYSSAIAVLTAQGCEFSMAARIARQYIACAIENSLELGHGIGPLNHFYNLKNHV